MFREKFIAQKSLIKGWNVIKEEIDYYDCSNIETTVIKGGITKAKAEKIAKLLNEE